MAPSRFGPRHWGQSVDLVCAASVIVAAAQSPRYRSATKTQRHEAILDKRVFVSCVFVADHGRGFIAKTCFSPRMMMMPSEMAGVAITTWPMWLVARSSYFGPALTTANVAVFARQIELAVGGDRRGAEGSAAATRSW
jgi:hypothetical protein